MLQIPLNGKLFRSCGFLNILYNQNRNAYSQNSNVRQCSVDIDRYTSVLEQFQPARQYFRCCVKYAVILSIALFI